MGRSMLSSILRIGFLCLVRFPSIPALTIQSIQDVSVSTSPRNGTIPGPALLALDVPASVEGSLPLGPELPNPTCNGDLLGFDMNSYSCLQAWNSIPPGSRDTTFGGGGDFDVRLPRRFSGRECVVLLLLA